MHYPKFYKNIERFTCIKSKTEFIQVNTMHTIGAIHYGASDHLVKDVERCDTETTAKEFEAAVLQHTDALIELTTEIKQMMSAQKRLR